MVNINYRRPAIMGDVLHIDCRLVTSGKRSGSIAQQVSLLPDGDEIARASLIFVCIDLNTQRAQPLEGELRSHLAALRPQGRG